MWVGASSYSSLIRRSKGNFHGEKSDRGEHGFALGLRWSRSEFSRGKYRRLLALSDRPCVPTKGGANRIRSGPASGRCPPLWGGWRSDPWRSEPAGF